MFLLLSSTASLTHSHAPTKMFIQLSDVIKWKKHEIERAPKKEQQQQQQQRIWNAYLCAFSQRLWKKSSGEWRDACIMYIVWYNPLLFCFVLFHFNVYRYFYISLRSFASKYLSCISFFFFFSWPLDADKKSKTFHTKFLFSNGKQQKQHLNQKIWRLYASHTRNNYETLKCCECGIRRKIVL